MRTLVADLRHAVRALTRTPSFAAAVVAVLALGIGATTAMFSVVHGVLLRPLPYGDPDRLVRVWTTYGSALGRGAVSAANGRDWRARNRVFEDLAIFHTARSFNFTGRGEPERLRGARVSASLFPVLRVAPLLGRTFTERENEIGHEDVVVLSHALWRRHFGADPSIVGRAIPLNGVPTTVVGVMPPDFRYPSREFELWVPLTVPPDEYLERSSGSYGVVARLEPGVTLERARADLRDVAAGLARDYPEYAALGAGLAPLLDDLVGDVRRPLFVLLGAVGAMLLIGCANLTNLLLARGIARRRELSVRMALGASYGRLVGQSITELLPLLAVGGVLGLLVAAGLVRAVAPLLPADLPRTENIGIDLPVLGFSVAALVLVALVAGLWPAVDAARGSVRASVAELSRGATSAPRLARVRDVLVIGQIATTLLLLVGATVLARSLLAVRDVSPGFDPRGVSSVHVAIPSTKYPSGRDVVAFYARVLERVEALPGVVAAGMVNRLPLSGNNQTGGLQADGVDPDVGSLSVQTRTVSPDYFRTLGIPLREGRPFAASDGLDAPRVAIVDERLARTLWPGASAVGRRVRLGDGAWSTVVGVVGHVRHTALDDESEPQAYWNHPQRVQERMALVVKTRGDPAALPRSIAAAVRAVDPDQPIYDARPLEAVVGRSLAGRRLQAVLLGAFAAAALVLASVGAYGVIAYGVGQRLREFGIRIALGAGRRDVVATVLRRGGTLFALGALVGLALAAAAARLLSSLVYGVAPRDAVSFVVSTVVLFVASMAACWVPARRAARVEPSVALRGE